jgi:hypothetical protein
VVSSLPSKYIAWLLWILAGNVVSDDGHREARILKPQENQENIKKG